MPDELLLKGGRLVSPADMLDTRADLGIRDGVIVPPDTLSARAAVLDLQGQVVAPGFIDLHVHLRDPGQTAKEDLLSGTAAAARGGFTTVMAMPNTLPAMDTPEILRDFLGRAEREAAVTVWQSAAFTRDRAGRELADLAALRDAGAAAFTDDGGTPQTAEVMRLAMRQAAALGMTVVDHCEDLDLSKPGVMHAGPISGELGWPGQPRAAEESIVVRDIALSRETGCRVHLQHLSSAGSVALLRQARRDGVPVSGEVTPHHLLLTDAAVRQHGSQAKMAPPLREESDRQALLQGIADGTLTVVATDHAPHTAAEKAKGMLEAPFGIIGLEAAIPICLTLLYHSGLITLSHFVSLFTCGPAAVLNRPAPSLAAGQPADLTLFAPDADITLDINQFLSRSRNCPYQGLVLRGCPTGIIRRGHHRPCQGYQA